MLSTKAPKAIDYNYSTHVPSITDSPHKPDAILLRMLPHIHINTPIFTNIRISITIFGVNFNA